MSSKYQPWCLGAVHSTKMIIKVLELGGASSEAVLSTHQHKVDTAKIKTKPTEKGKEN